MTRLYIRGDLYMSEKNLSFIKFGPGGMGPEKEIVGNIEKFSSMGIKSGEIEFTYGIYIKSEKYMNEIKDAVKKFDFKLSIHSQYWINLNSTEKKKIEDSKKRILDCCRVGEKIGARVVVFHAGFYGKRDFKETYENIKNAIIEIQEEIKKNKWKIKIAPETMGKINVFGSIEDISNLAKDTGCSFCIDFAHILARDKKVNYEKIKELFGKFKEWHCHFSGIVYTEKGERHHILTEDSVWKELFKGLKNSGILDGSELVIINESPDPLGDSLKGLKIFNKSHF